MTNLGCAFRAKRSYLTEAFGAKEILAKVDLMEDQFNRPMAFDEALVPPNPLVTGQGIGAWGEGVAVYGVARGYR